MKLGDMFPGAFPAAQAARDIAGVTMDSRQVGPGFAFVAVAGSKADGLRFVPDALSRGAAAIVGEAARPPGIPDAIAYAKVACARQELARAAARLHPRQPATIVAVTGTSGKSSVADFTRQIFAACGRDAASLGTLGLVTPAGATYGSLTTPDPVSLHQTLDRLAGEGITHVAMEASSHGLDQRRLDGVKLTAGGFTNLGRDHLDYHPDVEAYFAAKLRLFERLLPEHATAVVNADDPQASRVIATTDARGLARLTVGGNGADLHLDAVAREGFGQRLTMTFDGQRREVLLPLIGAFQVSNALVAAGLAIASGEAPGAVLGALAYLRGVRGRMERVAEVNGALVVVDYAHKPEALANVLEALRPYARRLVCVIGAGGDRDRGKRPLMGAIAAQRADEVIVTDDNPRSEPPASIRAAILAAAPGAREIGDRGEAIRAALRGVGPGDVLVIAGKGHETGQIVGSRTLPFSDHEAVLAAAREIAA